MALCHGRPFRQHVANADGRVNGRRHDEGAVERSPQHAAAGAAENIGGAHALAGGIENDGDMHEDERRHERGGHALPDVKAHAHALSSPLSQASVLARLRPAMDAVGLSACGLCSWQDWCEWQEWQPPEAATALSLSGFAASRSSLSSDHARLSAAGPRYPAFHRTVSHAA